MVRIHHAFSSSVYFLHSSSSSSFSASFSSFSASSGSSSTRASLISLPQPEPQWSLLDHFPFFWLLWYFCLRSYGLPLCRSSENPRTRIINLPNLNTIHSINKSQIPFQSIYAQTFKDSITNSVSQIKHSTTKTLTLNHGHTRQSSLHGLSSLH